MGRLLLPLSWVYGAAVSYRNRRYDRDSIARREASDVGSERGESHDRRQRQDPARCVSGARAPRARAPRRRAFPRLWTALPRFLRSCFRRSADCRRARRGGRRAVRARVERTWARRRRRARPRGRRATASGRSRTSRSAARRRVSAPSPPSRRGPRLPRCRRAGVVFPAPSRGTAPGARLQPRSCRRPRLDAVARGTSLRNAPDARRRCRGTGPRRDPDPAPPVRVDAGRRRSRSPITRSRSMPTRSETSRSESFSEWRGPRECSKRSHRRWCFAPSGPITTGGRLPKSGRSPSQAKRKGAKALLTTRKDAVKMLGWWESGGGLAIPLYALRIETEIVDRPALTALLDRLSPP